MRCDPDARATLEKGVEASEERPLHDFEVLERNRARLDVDPLAEAHARAEVAEVGDVGERALEIRLQDDPDVVEPFAAQGAVERERVVDARCVLHVDPHECVPRSGRTDEALEKRPAEPEIELEPETR